MHAAEQNVQAQTQQIELPELPSAAGAGAALLGGNLDAIQNVRISLTVRIGEVEHSVGELMNMKDAQVVKLNSLVDSPVDLLLADKVVARGHLIAVDEYFGVQITEFPRTKA
jgi:flagellar motor switch protein FliN/FliY